MATTLTRPTQPALPLAQSIATNMVVELILAHLEKTAPGSRKQISEQLEEVLGIFADSSEVSPDLAAEAAKSARAMVNGPTI